MSLSDKIRKNLKGGGNIKGSNMSDKIRANLNIAKKETIPAKQVEQPNISPMPVRTVSLPSFLGGGEYKVQTPGEVIPTERSQSALGEPLPKKERDHIIPVSLGGTSEKENLQYLDSKPSLNQKLKSIFGTPYSAQQSPNRQAGKVAVELEAIKKYQDGQISLGEARAEIATKNQQILGLTPTPEEQTVKGQLKKGVKNIFNKITGKESLKQNFATQDRGLEYKPQATPLITSNITEGKMTTTPMITDYGTKEAVVDFGKFIYNEAKKPITNAIANKDLTEEQAKAKVIEKTIGKKGVENKIGTLNKVLSMYNPEVEPVKDLIEYDKVLETLTPEQKSLVRAEEKAEGAFKIAQIPTAPVRFLAGFPAVAIISYALEKSDSDLSVKPDNIKDENTKDIMKLLAGDTEVKRLMESDDLYGIVARSGAGMAGAVALMAILENPFVAGTGASVLLKAKIKKEAAEMIAKFGYKEYLKTVVKDTEKAIIAELKAGNISREMAEVALKEIGLPKSLAKELESEKLFEIKPKVEPNKPVVEATQKPQEARVEPKTSKTDIKPSGEKTVKSEQLKQEAKKYKSADEFIKAHSLYHGTPAKIEGGKLSFGKGDIKKGGQSGGLFLTDNPNSAKTFAFGGEVYQATPEIKSQVIDLTKKEGIDKFKAFIGKSYKNFDGELIKFDKQSFDLMFPNEKADFATVSQFPELVEKIVKDNNLKGIAFNEYAGGEIGKTYQILSGDIPVYTKSQLTDIWNKANKQTLPKPKKQPIKYEPIEKPVKSTKEITYEPIKEKTPKTKEKIIDRTTYRDENFSRHYERIKKEFGFSDEGVEITRTTTKEMDRKAFDYIQRDPQKAMRVAYGMEKAPVGQNLTAIQRSLMVTLKDSGKTAQAENIARLLSKGLTEAGQTLNVAKMDMGSRGIIKNITDQRLERLGRKLGDKPEQALEMAQKKIKSESVKAGKQIVAETSEKLSQITIKQVDDFINKLIC